MGIIFPKPQLIKAIKAINPISMAITLTAMGVPSADVANAASLLGQKLTINEFVAFNNLTTKAVPIVTEKGILIVSIAICGFANFSSVGMQIGGIGELAPTRRADLAKLGLKALLCGTLASYLSATIAGILMS